MNTELHVLILAAGQGRRMRSRLPKVLLPVGGVAMLDHVLQTALTLAPKRIDIVVGHQRELLVERYADRGVGFVEQPEPRGTGDAVARALPHIAPASRVLVLYGDVPLIRTASLESLLLAGAGAAVLVVEASEPAGYGRVLIDGQDRVSRVVEERDTNSDERRVKTVNTGLCVFDGASLHRWLPTLRSNNAQGELYLTDLFERLASHGQGARAVWLADASEAAGANDPGQLADLEALYQRRRRSELLQSGVRMVAPQTVVIRGPVEAGLDVELEPGVILEGPVRLGDGAVVGPYCVLRQCEIGDQARIAAYSLIDGATVGSGAVVGPFARLRPGTVLGERAHVGNFVELKNTVLGNDSKANHLSYLGDARIGRDVNIGAGTITCNYDGANKWTTTVGDRVFVGSNSALVAPVHLGDGATIGAGSVITKDAPAEQLSVARARQQAVPGWKRPRKGD